MHEKWNQYKETLRTKYAKDFEFEALKRERLFIVHTQQQQKENANTKNNESKSIKTKLLSQWNDGWKEIKIKDKQTMVGSRKKNRAALNHKNLSHCGNWNFHLNRIQYALIIAIHTYTI